MMEISSTDISSKMQKLSMLPYHILTIMPISVIFLMAGLATGGTGYLIVSFLAFVIHLMIKNLFKNRHFDYPIKIGKSRKINNSFLSGAMLSFVFGVFASGYFGIIDKTVVESIEIIITKNLGSIAYMLVIATAPMFLTLFLWPIIVRGRIKNALHETLLFIAIVIILGILAAWLLSNTSNSALFDSKEYMDIIQFAFGAPSLWAIRMLFIGFSEDEYNNCFRGGKRSDNEEYFAWSKKTDNQLP